MICAELFSVIGVSCTPMDDAGTVALIETPFRFADGDAMSIFVEKTMSGVVRFFDEGGTLMHLAGRGVDVRNAKRLHFLSRLEQAHKVKLTERGELEALALPDKAGEAFANYVQAMLAVAQWESEHEGVDTDAAELLDEVAAALTRCYPHDELRRSVSMTGISRQSIAVDFVVGRRAFFAIRPNRNAVSSVIRKVLDLSNTRAGSEMHFEVIIDERNAPEVAHDEGMVIAAVADVSHVGVLLKKSADVSLN